MILQNILGKQKVMSKKEDGGFIAIRGFAFQFDKAILEILKNPTIRYQVENLQDYNFNDYAVQVKYYAADYTRSKRKSQLKGFIVKLLKEFRNDNSIKYCIYAYYKGIQEETVQLSISELDDYLGENKNDFNQMEKQNFLTHFKIIYAPDFKRQFEDVIEQIKIQYNCNTDIAICHHAIMVSHLERLILKYEVDEASKRTCIKKDFDEILEKQEELTFLTGYKSVLDSTKYHSALRKKYFRRTPFQPKERLFIIEPNSEWELHEIEHVLLGVAMKWTNNNLNRVLNRERCSPAFFIRTENTNLISLKQQLYQSGKSFQDGYPFAGAAFDPARIHCAQSPTNKLDMFFVNDLKEVELILTHRNLPAEIFQFYQTTPVEPTPITRHTAIKVNNINEILEIA